MSRLGCPRTFVSKGICKQGIARVSHDTHGPRDSVTSDPGYQLVLLLEPVLDLIEGDEVTPGNSCLPKYADSGDSNISHRSREVGNIDSKSGGW